MSRSLVKRNPPVSGTTLVIGVALIALIVWLVMKSKQAPIGEYRNLETWDVQYSPDGLPTKITIHREAKRQ